MHISAYNDKQSGWGKQLLNAAFERGHSTQLCFNGEDYPDAGYFFARVEQFPPLHVPSKMFALHSSCLPGVKPIINLRELRHYERKDLQAEELHFGMPFTFVCRNQMQADRALNQLRFPIVSKAAFGSSSSNVRLLLTEATARAEFEQAMSPAGLPAENKRGVQQGYVIWQQYLPGNAYVYRCAKVGRWMWLLQVFNRKDSPFASGSGNYAPVVGFDSEARNALQAGADFFGRYGMNWCAIDLARDPFTNEWLALETTIAWNMRAPTANAACPIVDRGANRHPKAYYGCDMWQLLLDEIEAGVFG